MTEAAAYVLTEQIGFLLRKAHQRHRLIFSTEVANEIAPAQFSALAKLYEIESVWQNELGRLIALDSATIKGVVDRLVERGLVRSSQSPDDERLRIIELTDAGRTTIEPLFTVADRITQLTLEPLSEKEAATLVRLLAKMSR